MKKCNELLSYNFSSDELIRSARNIISVSSNNVLNINLNKLIEIGVSDKQIDVDISTQSIVVNKFKEFISQNELDYSVFSKKEKRNLCYSLSYSEPSFNSILSNTSEFEIFLILINSTWKDSFLKGLLYNYLFYWNSKSESTLSFQNFIIGKINSYQGANKFFVFFKENNKYLNCNNGDTTLGYELAIKKINLKEITNFINRPKSWITFSYFSKVILAYYEKNQKDISSFIDDLFLVLLEHNNSDTYKRVISKLILQANNIDYQDFKEVVKLKALHIIGDPSINTYWAPYEKATENEVMVLKQAQNILNEWLTTEFISIFFQECINDPRRKHFWLKYASKISSFKVFGPDQIKFLLKRNKTIGKFVNSRFITTRSTQNISAFVFVLGDYKMIEFSDKGYAFIASKIDLSKPIFPVERINTVADLRSSSETSQLVNRSGRTLYNISDNGRLSHSDGELSWEQTFAYWINNKTNINV